MTQNPLISENSNPNAAPSFGAIKPEHFSPAFEYGIEQARANIEAIKNNPEAPSFDNTIVALEVASEVLGDVAGIYYNMLSMMGGDDLHALVTEIGPLQSNFSSDVIMDADLFTRVQAVYEQRDALDLTTEQRTLLEENYSGFVRGGALLSNDKKAELRALNEQSSVMGPEFMNNVAKSSEDFELVLEESDLDGLPDTAKTAAKAEAQERGYADKYVITLDFPSYIPFITYAKNRALRERLWRAFAERGYNGEYDNHDLVFKIVNLRHKRARLLGYDTHADFVLQKRMAESADNVMAFLDTLYETYRPAAEKDFEDIKAFAKKYDGSDDLKQWDIGYYSEKLKEERFAFSSEELRPYFQQENVMKGLFEHAGKLFNIRMEEVEGKYQTWHDDVKVYEVFDVDRDNALTGVFYTDLFPRKGKKSGAWMTTFRDRGLYRGKVEPPLVAIACNFTKPAGDQPSLLTLEEVLTLFHEFGHAMHALLAQGTYQSLSGTNVYWDFVELPSQLQENWVYETETLALFARHYKTGADIPTDLVEKVRQSSQFMAGWGGLRQLSLGYLDMGWHIAPPDLDKVEDVEDAAMKKAQFFPRVTGATSTSFNHIFAGGYSAGYYSYKWAEVLDADTFEAFKESGLYDHDTAYRYKSEVLAKGGAEHPAILYRNFRGRDADPKALLRREGLFS